MTFLQAQQYLDSFVNPEHTLHQKTPEEFKLDAIRQLCARLGNPQQRLKIIHVAGSKGKGSTCALIASILKASGLRVGLYTSPHLYDFRERIRVLGDKQHTESDGALFDDSIDADGLTAMIERVKPAIEQLQAEGIKRFSYFEVLTAMAFLYFEHVQVDWVVLETGLGGRLDATNIADAQVAVITPISLEHTHLLGDSVEKIAFEKAAIIKKGTGLAVFARQEAGVYEVLEKCAKERDVAFCHVDDVCRVVSAEKSLQGQDVDVNTARHEYRRLDLPLLGVHQQANMLNAITVCEHLMRSVDGVTTESIAGGISTVIWPGRFEIVRAEPAVILDGAHNVASAQSLVLSLKKLFSGPPFVLILGMCEGKELAGFCRELVKVVSAVVLTKADYPRADRLRADKIQPLFDDVACCETESFREAYSYVRHRFPARPVLITGSLYLVAEARRFFKK